MCSGGPNQVPCRMADDLLRARTSTNPDPRASSICRKFPRGLCTRKALRFLLLWLQLLFVQQPISNQAACLRFVRLVRSDLFWSLQLSVSAFFRHAVASQIRSTGSPVKRQMAYASGSRNDRRLLKTLSSKYSQPEHPHLINLCS